MSTVKVLYHSQCFDGFSSAAVFTRFYREVVDEKANFVYQGLRHGAPKPVDSRLFDSDHHAIVDFRYSSDRRLDWWFDHHRSAFVSPDEREHYDTAEAPQHFWDPDEPSCAGYMSRVLAQSHDFETKPIAELIRWADVIDTARFESPSAAIELKEPALQLMSVLQHQGDGALATDIINALADGQLFAVAQSKAIQKRFARIHKAQLNTLETVRELATRRGEDIVFIDMTEVSELANRFSAYYLYPESTYAVVVRNPPGRIKISVGSNPWHAERRRHNIARICEQFGGGGHAVVGGITLPGTGREQGLQIANEVVDLLSS